ncbi:protein of unknown function [Clostridium beijerinckii]|nr:protein of unknown function [Clostridium beijerinckii]
MLSKFIPRSDLIIIFKTKKEQALVYKNLFFNGDSEGARTLDLRRDRPAL